MHATPGRVAAVHGERHISWRLLASRSRSLAWYLSTDCGVRGGDHVVILLPNCPEHLETFLAARKLRAVPLGIGVTSGVNELHVAIDRSDARVVVTDSAAADDVRTAVRRIPKRWRPVVVEIGAHSEEVIAAATPPPDWELETPTADDLIAIAELDASAETATPGPTVLSVGPFAEGDSFGELLGALARKGTVVFLEPSQFDARAVWDTVRRESVTRLVIGGDVQARLLLAALGSRPAETFSALETIASTGAPLGSDVAAALATALPNVTVLGATEPVADIFGAGHRHGAPVRCRAPAEEARQHRGLRRAGDLRSSDRETRGWPGRGRRQPLSRRAGARGLVPGTSARLADAHAIRDRRPHRTYGVGPGGRGGAAQTSRSNGSSRVGERRRSPAACGHRDLRPGSASSVAAPGAARNRRAVECRRSRPERHDVAPEPGDQTEERVLVVRRFETECRVQRGVGDDLVEGRNEELTASTASRGERAPPSGRRTRRCRPLASRAVAAGR